MENRDRFIQITHIINPSLFYCRDLSLASEEQAKVKIIEEKLKSLAESVSFEDKYFFEPQEGDVSMVYVDTSIFLIAFFHYRLLHITGTT